MSLLNERGSPPQLIDWLKENLRFELERERMECMDTCVTQSLNPELEFLDEQFYAVKSKDPRAYATMEKCVSVFNEALKKEYQKCNYLNPPKRNLKTLSD